MVIVAGHVYVDPAERDAYAAGCRGVVEAARAAPGCLDFVIAADLIEPNRVNIYERWESDEALERFRGAGPPPEQQAKLLDAAVARYRISSVEPA